MVHNILGGGVRNANLCEVRIIPGESWNHSEFTTAAAAAAATAADTLRVFIIPPPLADTTTTTAACSIPGISDETLRENMRLQTAMGLATVQVLEEMEEANGKGRRVLHFYGPQCPES
ncbi:hypothetical protein MN608_10316 [Microdochium nivale]|nr:hypothetical protein MN608_10316 [Microdochium nivale]